jgi:hypothetical protein
MGDEKDATIPQLTLGGLREQSGVSSVIRDARKMDQLEDNLGAIDVSFADGALERIDELTKPAPNLSEGDDSVSERAGEPVVGGRLPMIECTQRFCEGRACCGLHHESPIPQTIPTAYERDRT